MGGNPEWIYLEYRMRENLDWIFFPNTGINMEWGKNLDRIFFLEYGMGENPDWIFPEYGMGKPGLDLPRIRNGGKQGSIPVFCTEVYGRNHLPKPRNRVPKPRKPNCSSSAGCSSTRPSLEQSRCCKRQTVGAHGLNNHWVLLQ